MPGPGNRTHDRPLKSSRFYSRALYVPAILAVFLVAVGVYLHAADYYFSQDDFTFLARAIGLNPPPDFLAPLGARIISTRLYFDLMHGLFKLDPGPYHTASILLHALNAILVVALTRRLTGEASPAIVAGFVFATFDLAFTAVFWASGVQDLLATMFLLVSATIWVARRWKGVTLSALSAGALILSLLSKEIGVLFPVVLALLAWAQGVWGRRSAVALIPHAAVSLAAIALFLVQNSRVSEGGAYGSQISSHLLHNLATYIMWTVDVIHPFKDRLAAIDYGAWRTALPAAAVTAIALLALRRESRRRAWIALAWYALILAPVLPLLRHTYLYYLYPASVGAAIFVGVLLHGVSETLSRRLRPDGRTVSALSMVAVTAALCVMGAINVRARERTRLGPDFVLPHDHVLRTAELAKSSTSTFPMASVPQGSDLLLINPYGAEAVDLSEETPTAAGRVTFDMVRMALRNGDVFKVLRPDLADIAFARRMERGWEDRQGLLYDGYGRLTYLGRGADIWANLSTVHLLRTSQLEESMRCSRRALEINPNHPRATLNLGIALAMTGSELEAREYLTRAAETAPSESHRAQALKWLGSLDAGR